MSQDVLKMWADTFNMKRKESESGEGKSPAKKRQTGEPGILGDLADGGQADRSSGESEDDDMNEPEEKSDDDEFFDIQKAARTSLSDAYLGSCFIFHIAVYYQCFQFVFLCVTLEIESVGCRLLRKTRNRKEHRIHTGKGHCVTNVLCSFLCVILCAGFLSFQSVTKWMNNEVQNEVYV